MALSLQTRWAGVVSIALKKAVATAVLREEGADLSCNLVEPTPGMSVLAV